MWNAVKNETPRSQIRDAHIKALQDALDRAAEGDDPRRPEVTQALLWLQESSNRGLGFTLFRQGIEGGNELAMRDGLRKIKQHLGVE